jgi:hypothetical protein
LVNPEYQTYQRMADHRSRRLDDDFRIHDLRRTAAQDG